MYGYYSSNNIKRKVFISYYHGDQQYVNKFISDFSDIFIPKAVGIKERDFEFDSSNPQYIMRKIREQVLEDSTVTIVLIGNCTHSRRYVDWEIKASLQQGATLPNGLIAINLPYMGTRGNLPNRLSENVIKDEWIEDAYSARTTRAGLIHNSKEMMKYNSMCRIHGVTH